MGRAKKRYFPPPTMFLLFLLRVWHANYTWYSLTHFWSTTRLRSVLLISLIACMGWILSGLRITHLQSLGMAAARLLKCPIPALDTRYVKAELKFVATGGRVRFCRLCKLPQKTTVFTRPILPDGPSLWVELDYVYDWLCPSVIIISSYRLHRPI